MKLRYLLAVAFAMAVLTAWSPEARADGWEAFDVESDWNGTPILNGTGTTPGNPASGNVGGAVMHSNKTATGTTSGSGYAIVTRRYEKTGEPGNLQITLDYTGTAFWSAEVVGQGGSNGGAALVEVLPDEEEFGPVASVERSVNGSSAWGYVSGTSSDDDSVQKVLTATITLHCYIAVSSSAFVNAIDYGEGKATGGTTWH